MKKKTKKQVEQLDAPVETAIVELEEKRFFDSTIFWRVSSVLIIVLAGILRLIWPGLKPFHHDEGVNGFFLTTLFKQGTFHYDPSNYHGPTLYFIALVPAYLCGLNTFAVRLTTAVFGVLIVTGILSLRRYLGNVGALVAALLIALSPGMTFISRYFIHEMLFVFFTLAVVLGIVKFIEDAHAGNFAVGVMSILLLVCQIPLISVLADRLSGTAENLRLFWLGGAIIVAGAITFWSVHTLTKWRDGRFIYLLLAAAAASLAFATKETAFISFGTMLIALFVIAIWPQIRRNSEEDNELSDELSFKNFFGRFGNRQNVLLIAVLCFGFFAYLWALFFTSFFTYEKGIEASFAAYNIWSKTGSTAHTQNGLWAYFRWLWQLEAPILLLGALGSALALWKARNRFAMFAALWGFGLLAAYTIISYKTPWLAVNFILPLALAAGYAIDQLGASRVVWQRSAAAFLTALACGISAYQCLNFNFYRYDDAAEPYVYAHTKREFLDLVREIDRIAQISGKENETNIAIVSPDYWPLPWYLRDYKNVGFHGKIVPALNTEIIIGSFEQENQLETNYSSNYTYTGLYPLRPGVDLMLYVRNDLAGKITDQTK